jgi:Na+/H+ antiporter NhaC
MKPKYTALLPFGIFLTIFILLNIIYNDAAICKDNFPIISAVLAIIASFFTFRKNETLNEKVEIFIQGCSQTIVIHMCYIFYVSTVFTTILEQTGGIASAVNICLLLIPGWCILPGLFIVASLFSFTVGTSMGAIAAFMPIAVSIATQTGITPALMAATIVCGAMFGDNLSILSDTTIAAVKITGSNMKEKLILNTKIAAPAFILSLGLLTYQNYMMASSTALVNQPALQIYDLIKVIPYIITFALALIGFDILMVLVIGIFIAMGLGVLLSSLSCLQALNLIFDGFYASKGMVNVFMLVLLLAGLSNITTHNGGIEYLIQKLKHKITGPIQAKFAIFFLVSAINITIAINTIAILIAGPIATNIGNDTDINPEQTACILDIGSCVSQGLLPYAPQLLLAASMAQVSAISLLSYLYYQYFLAISLFVALLLIKKR